MTVTNKIMATATWLGVFVVSWLLLLALRQIGTAWINELGFLRVMGLLLFAIATLVPLVLAALVWFGIPKKLYKRFSN